jgi:hypothetical protein
VTQKLTSNFLTGLLILIASAPAAAQTVAGPISVCPGELFDVEWTGPDAHGDTITIAVPQYPADEVLDSGPTSDGSPVRLRAPFDPGVYELRYVQFEPQSILAREDILVDRCSSSSEEEEMPLIAVEARGFQIDHGDEINRSDETPYGAAGYTVDQLCAASPQIGQAMQMMVGFLEAGMQQTEIPVILDAIASMPGAPNQVDIALDISNARDAICDTTPPRTTIQPFVITYAYCRMAMYTPTHAMDIHIPVGRDGSMSMADHVKREVVKMTMHPNFEATSALLGRGWGDDIQMIGPGAAGSHIGYPTREYSFDYSGGIGEGPAGIPGITNTIKVKNTGSGWFSSQVPGMDIIRLFYHRMSNDVSRDGGAMSFFGGLINNMVGMLRKGIPLVMDQTTSSSVMGKTMVSGRSQHYLTSIKTVEFNQQWCDQTLMPSSYAVTDVDAQIAGAMGSSGVDADQMSEAMQQYNEAMENMTPEQQAMMESMGMGDMMQQAMGAAGAGAAGPASAGSNVKPSAALTTDNLTQSVQLHLDALGYDVGKTNGDESLATSIAISQYQAERGLDVTAEVSQQLLDALSAEINRGQ